MVNSSGNININVTGRKGFNKPQKSTFEPGLIGHQGPPVINDEDEPALQYMRENDMNERDREKIKDDAWYTMYGDLVTKYE